MTPDKFYAPDLYDTEEDHPFLRGLMSADWHIDPNDRTGESEGTATPNAKTTSTED